MTAAILFLALAACWGLLAGAVGYSLRPREPRATSHAYCPACRVDVLNDCVSVTECPDGSTLLKCGCGHLSRWLLDAPVPLLVRE